MCRSVCIKHDQLISPALPPPSFPPLPMRGGEIVWICTVLGQQFGQTKDDDSAFRSERCFVNGLHRHVQYTCSKDGALPVGPAASRMRTECRGVPSSTFGRYLLTYKTCCHCRHIPQRITRDILKNLV
jgi:hypothetical protein